MVLDYAKAVTLRRRHGSPATIAMPDLLRLVIMLAREAVSPPRLGRRPEPTALMDEHDSVEAFHEQGSPSGPLLPVYRFL